MKSKKINKKVVFNVVKLIIALIIGGIMGVRLLCSGDLLRILLFFAFCIIIGFILSKINIK